MGELDRRCRTLLANEIRNARKWFDVFVFPDAQIIASDASTCLNGAGFRHDQARATHGTTAQMY
jgi:hypothetical protein